MKKELLSFEQTGAFSSFFLDYAGNKPSLKDFFSRFPSVANFAEQIIEKKKSFTAESRAVLKASLEKQYGEIKPTGAVRKNIDLLESDTTFTIVTGHQLNLFSGPLYFIYKIVSTINACKQLKVAYPGYDFVPVYWMASEDHDFEEISYFKLLGKKYTWKTEQQGAVGRMHLKELLPLLSEVPGDLEPFAAAYKSSATLSEAVRKYVHALFADEGLIVIDADDRELKH
ncbi:MAG: bacillithiol biosynthesis cysteine-adding enzyme BshC, partial [Bacteroidota bacterium]